MSEPNLETFHNTSRGLDFVGPMEALLHEFRRGNIADKDRVGEAAAIRAHLGEHRSAWDRVFPAFPACPWKRRTLTWERYRGRRDAYLERLVVAQVRDHAAGDGLIVNPATVIGRHARSLARELPGCEVVGTDIDPLGDRLFRFADYWHPRKPKNYRFVCESIYALSFANL